MLKYFKELTIGASFKRGNVQWVKRSTRTAQLVENGRIFYFSANDVVEHVK